MVCVWLTTCQKAVPALAPRAVSITLCCKLHADGLSSRCTLDAPACVVEHTVPVMLPLPVVPEHFHWPCGCLALSKWPVLQHCQPFVSVSLLKAVQTPSHQKGGLSSLNLAAS